MIIAEIGFNHMGNIENARNYLDVLTRTEIDAVTFQIREREHREKKPHRYLPDESYVEFFEKIKNSGKKIGIAIADVGYIQFFEELGVDFYKVIRNDITNSDLLERLSQTRKRIYVSTGMSSEKDILTFSQQSFVRSGDYRLVHTQLSYSLEDCNLKSIETMRKYGIPVAYGNHCEEQISIFMSLCYEPSDILFYIKGEEDVEYPDHKHSIKINEVGSLVDKIRQAELSIGTGKKVEMKNKIEEKK